MLIKVRNEVYDFVVKFRGDNLETKIFQNVSQGSEWPIYYKDECAFRREVERIKLFCKSTGAKLHLHEVDAAASVRACRQSNIFAKDFLNRRLYVRLQLEELRETAKPIMVKIKALNLLRELDQMERTQEKFNKWAPSLESYYMKREKAKHPDKVKFKYIDKNVIPFGNTYTPRYYDVLE